MPNTRRRCPNARQLAHAALLASASFMSVTFATEAHAQCTTNNAQPVSNVVVDGTVVTCTGAVVGQNVQVNANEVDVEITGGGTNVSGGSNIFVIGSQNEVYVRTGATLTASTVYTLGANSGVVVQGNVVGAGITVDGAGSGLFLDTNGLISLAPGNLSVFNSAGATNTITLRGTLEGSSSTGSYLLRGGNGQQRVFVSGTINVQADGLAMDLGADNDEIYLQAGANLAGGSGNNILINGGLGNDRLEIDDSGLSHFNTIGIETLVLDPGAGGIRGLSGSHADVTQFSVASGTVNVTNLAALGQANSNVLIVAGAQLNLSQAGGGTFDHVLAGSGTLALNFAGTTYTFGGTGSTFDGVFAIGQNNTAVLVTGDALGTASIVNAGTLSFGGINVANDISGTGQVIVTGNGNGNSRLSGTNTFSGGLDIQGGVLDVASVNALGSSFVTSTTSGGILAVGNTSDEVLSNDLTGNLILVKAGSGVLDVTGTNSYVLGTLINGGAKDRQRRLRPAAAGLEGSDRPPPLAAAEQTTPARRADRSISSAARLPLRQELTSTHSRIRPAVAAACARGPCASRHRALRPDRVCYAAITTRGLWRFRRKPPVYAPLNPRSASRGVPRRPHSRLSPAARPRDPTRASRARSGSMACTPARRHMRSSSFNLARPPLAERTPADSRQPWRRRWRRGRSRAHLCAAPPATRRYNHCAERSDGSTAPHR